MQGSNIRGDDKSRFYTRARVAIFCSLLAVCLATITCMPANANALSNTTWTPLGPAPVQTPATYTISNISGRVTGITADPVNSSIIYVATGGGGVWKTTDGGMSWTPLTDSLATLSMGAIALSPANPDMIYAGTGDANNRWDSNYGRGILVSADGGATWTLSSGPGGALNRLTTSRIAVDAADITGKTAYAAMANQGINGLSGNTGIWKTTDGGATWVNTTASIDTTDSWSDIVIDPNNHLTLYAAIGNYHGSSNNGVYKSTNGGTSWTLLANAPKGGNSGRILLTVAKTNSQVVYVSASSSGGGAPWGALYKFMRSDDGGNSFIDLTAGTPNYLGVQGYYDTSLTVDPTNAAIVYAGGQQGANSILRSINGGVDWSDISVGGSPNFVSPHINHHAFFFDASGRLLDGNDGGIYRLDNPTVPSWTDLNGNLGTIIFFGIGLHPTNSAVAIGGTGDNGAVLFTGTQVWMMTDAGVAGFDSGISRFSKTNTSRAYHQSPPYSAGWSFFRRSEDGGNSWTTKTSTMYANPGNPGLGPDLEQLFAPFVVDPGNGDRVLYGTIRIWETLNGGDNWARISDVNQNGFNNNACTGGCRVDAIGLAPSDANTVYAATGGDSATSSQIFVTTNHGSSWTEHDLGVGGRVKDIQVDPGNSQIAYAVISTFNGPNGQVFKTTNGGGSWTNISGNLPVQPVWSLQIDPSTTPNTLYVGADDGVYITTDGGTTWSRFGTGLPNAQVYQLELNSSLHILGAATHGRGMWEILTPASVSDLTIAKSHSGSFTQGQTGSTYTITVSNSGTGPTSGTVTVTDAVPAGLTATAISGTGWSCTQPSGPCTRSDALTASSSYPDITLTVNVAGNAPSSVTNTATVSGGGETSTGNDTATSPTTINSAPVPDLTITKNHVGNFTQGQTGATYTITASNGGTVSTAGTVTVTDILPAGLTATAIGGTGWSCTQPSGPCTRSDALAAGSSYPAITLTVNVAGNAPSSVTNTATVSGGGETNTANDTATSPTTINSAPGPDLTITKNHVGNFTQGQSGAVYTITVSNSGTAATTGTVTVLDNLPVSLTATAMTGSGWTCGLNPLQCSRSDSLAAGAVYSPITLTVNVASKSPGSVTNTATVSGGGETNIANDTAADKTSIKRR